MCNVIAGVILTHERQLKTDPPEAEWPPITMIRAGSMLTQETLAEIHVLHPQSIRAIAQKFGM